MRVTVSAVSPATRRRADAVIDADPDTPVAEIAAGLDSILNGKNLSRARFGPRAAGHPAPLAAPVTQQRPRLFTGGQPLPGDTRFAGSLIRDGSTVSLGDPSGCTPPERAGVAEICVVAGPAAGMLHRLPFGEADIGGPVPGETEVVIADPSVPSPALRVFIDPEGFQVAPFDGVQGLLDRQPLAAAAYWRPGQQVAVGGTFLEIAPYEPPTPRCAPPMTVPCWSSTGRRACCRPAKPTSSLCRLRPASRTAARCRS